ncbi:SpaA isopeptide-forming pilin-related protein [Corynebacterium phocae]|uniref:SpaA isopeptide-forming pilin-related protein n=1 Tax=Corynebacterium phocae TaxID=161895 RepID=UPI001289F43E|nr:SpaA isopeptide-forming pilin-related protein [Corynebacterium phocae]KAA8725968.1 hypothetical protein F4V58_03500 [Corynebacterium phocae]
MCLMQVVSPSLAEDNPGAQDPVIASESEAGSTAEAGDVGTADAGDVGTADAGDVGTVDAGDSSTAGGADDQAEPVLDSPADPAEESVTLRRATAGDNQDPLKIDLFVGTREELKGEESRLDYWSGETVNSIVSLDVSGADVNLRNAVLTLTFPKVKNEDGKLLTNEPGFVDSNLATSSVNREDDEAWYKEYHFDTLKGGQITQLPFLFNFINHITPDGTTVTPTVALSADNFDTIEEEVTFTAKAADGYRTDLRLWRKDYANFTEVDGKKVGVYRFNSDPLTGVTPPEEPEFRYYACISPDLPQDVPRGLGVYDAKKVTFEIEIPEESEPTEEALRRWKWKDESQRVLVATPSYEWSLRSFDCRYVVSGLGLNLTYKKDTLISDGNGEMRVFRPSINTWVDKGTPEEQYVGSDVEGTGFVEIEDSFAPRHTINMNKWAILPYWSNYVEGSGTDSHYIYDGRALAWERDYNKIYLAGDVKGGGVYLEPNRYFGDPETTTPGVMEHGDKTLPGLRWRYDISQTNNGSGHHDSTGGIHDFVHSVTDYDLDPALYYNEFHFDARYSYPPPGMTKKELQNKINAIGNHLYGIDSSGTRHVLAEDLPMGGRVAIMDKDRKYDQLEMVFKQPVELDNFKLGFDIRAYPTPEEAERWRNREIENSEKIVLNRVKADIRFNAPDGPQYESFAAGVEGKTETLDGETNFPENNGFLENNKILLQGVDPKLGTRILTTSHTDPQAEENPIKVHKMFSAKDALTSYEECDEEQLTQENCARIRTLEVRTKPAGSWGGVPRVLENLRQIVLLPPGVTYVETLGHIRDDETHWGQGQPEVVENFKNLGLTALIYSFGDVTYNSPSYEVYESNLSTFLTVDTTKYANFGPNEIKVFTTWDSNAEIRPADTSYQGRKLVDDLDLDDDGNTTEDFLQASRVLTLSAPLEVLSKIEVSPSLDRPWTLHAPNQELGSDLFYRMTVSNNTLVPVRSMSILGVLPHTGDHKIVSNQDGEYPNREWESSTPDGDPLSGDHSAFSTPLRGPALGVEITKEDGSTVDATDRFEVLYTTTPQGDDLESITLEANWVKAAEVTNWNAVTAVKADLVEGAIDSREIVRIILPAQVPFNDHMLDNVKNGERAVMSMAISGAGNNYIEANEVSSQPVRYSVSTGVFRDLNANGIKEPGEQWLSDYGWVLQEQDGDTVYNPGDQAVAGTTVGTGPATTPVIPGGTDRTVVFSKSEAAKQRNLYWTQHAPADREFFSDLLLDGDKAKADDASSVPFALVPLHPHAQRFAGLAGSRDLTLVKTASDSNAVQEGVQFKLVWKSWLDEEVPTEEVLPVQQEWEGSTDANGELTFGNLPYGIYELSEQTPLAGYQAISPRRIVISAAGDNPAQPLREEVVNDPTEARVQLLKTDNQGVPVKGATFGLFEQEPTCTAPADAAQGQPSGAVTPISEAAYSAQSADGVVTFDNVVWGSYYLCETEGVIGYERDTQVRRVEVSADTVESVSVDGSTATVLTVDAGTVVNNRTLGTVTVEKTVGGVVSDSKVGQQTNQDEGAPLPGAQFALVAKDFPGVAEGTVVSRATTALSTDSDATGVKALATFNDVAWGSYELVETQAPEGFVLLADNGDKVERRVIQEVTVDAGHSTIAVGEVSNHPVTGSVTLVKKSDNGKPLEGVEFSLFAVTPDSTQPADSAPVYTATSDANGHVNFDNVRFGSYELRETKALEGYVPLTRGFQVNISEHGSIVDLGDVTNDQVRGSVVLRKVDGTTGNPLAGGVFEIFPTDSAMGATDVPLDTQTSDETGQVRFSERIYGSYVVREKAAPVGWVTDDRGREVTIDSDGQVVDLGRVANVRAYGQVDLEKVDKTSGNPLAGAKFEVEAVDVYGVAPGTVVATATSDKKGRVSFERLAFGSYVVREKAAPAGWVTDDQAREVTIDSDGQVVDLGKIGNIRSYGTVSLHKVDDNSDKPLAGAKFEVEAVDVYDVAPGTVVATATSDEKGRVSFERLAFGSYVVREKAAPVGWVTDDRGREVTIDSDGQVVDLGRVANMRAYGQVELEKVDKSSKDPLEGAKFEAVAVDVYDVEPGTVVATGVSNDKGRVVIPDLAFGTYVVREHAAPDGWVKSDKEYPVKITASGKVVDLGKIKNEKIIGTAKLQKVDSVTGEPLQGAKFVAEAVVVYGKDAGEVMGKATSDANGQVVFKNLPYGTYSIRETKAPKGYLLDDREIGVSIVFNGVDEDLGEVGNLPEQPVSSGDDGQTPGATPTGTTTPTPETIIKKGIDKLAQTGASVLTLLGLALSLIVMGLALVAVRRRRS